MTSPLSFPVTPRWSIVWRTSAFRFVGRTALVAWVALISLAATAPLTPDLVAPGTPIAAVDLQPWTVGGLVFEPHAYTCVRLNERVEEVEVLYSVGWRRFLRDPRSPVAASGPHEASAAQPLERASAEALVVLGELKDEGWEEHGFAGFPNGIVEVGLRKGGLQAILRVFPENNGQAVARSVDWKLSFTVGADKDDVCPRHLAEDAYRSLQILQRSGRAAGRPLGLDHRQRRADAITLMRAMRVDGRSSVELAELARYGAFALREEIDEGRHPSLAELLAAGEEANRRLLLPTELPSALAEQREAGHATMRCINGLSHAVGGLPGGLFGGVPKVLREDPTVPLRLSGTMKGEARYEIRVEPGGRVIGVASLDRLQSRKKAHIAVMDSFHRCMSDVFLSLSLQPGTEPRTGVAVVSHEGDVGPQ